MSSNPQSLARLDAVPLPTPAPPPAAPTPAAPAAEPGHGAWPRYLAAWGALVVAMLLLLNKDVAHLVMRWWNSSTYGHCLLIVPIIVWLVWQRRDGLARLAPAPWLPGAALLLACGAVWMLGYLAGVALLRHAGIVLMLIASVPAMFGPTVARALTFPLFFALFMIPVGEQLEPWLQTITAEFATWLLRALGVPTHMDGVFISIPNGDFEVAQACSGVRFLIAMVAFGALVSNVCFLSWKRRLAFMAASFILPVLANGIRVWGTIHIAHVTTPEFARGVDHVVYGWVFFAVVMAALLAIGWRYFDRPVEDPFIYPEQLQRPGTPPGPTARLLPAGAIALAAAAAFPAWAAISDARGPEAPTGALAIAAPPGWRETGYAGLAWKPVYKNPTAERFSSFSDAQGRQVDVYLAVYDRQREGAEVVSYGQGIVDLLDEGGWAWAANERPMPGGEVIQINKLGTIRDVAKFYWVNGKLTGSQAQAKIEGLKARMLGGEPRAGVVIVAAERRDSFVSMRPAIEAFLASGGPPDALIARAIVPAGPAAASPPAAR